jgi:hypothetical protein
VNELINIVHEIGSGPEEQPMSKKNQETAIAKAPTAAIDRFSDDFQNYLVNLGLPATAVLATLGRSCSKSFRTCSWSGRMG